MYMHRTYANNTPKADTAFQNVLIIKARAVHRGVGGTRANPTVGSLTPANYIGSITSSDAVTSKPPPPPQRAGPGAVAPIRHYPRDGSGEDIH